MSLNLAEIGILGAVDVFLPKNSLIGGIQVDTTIEEIYEDSLEITSHPVEAGAEITDHSFKRPMELVLTCGWSDSSASGLVGLASGLISAQSPVAASVLAGVSAVSSLVNPSGGASGSFSGGAMAASDYVASIYSQLLQLQESRQTITVVSGLRSYNSMLIPSLRVRRDYRSQYALNVQATFRQIIIVSTQSATLAPQANQANPASTADRTNTGTQSLQAASPSSGGAFSPFSVP